MKKQLSLMLAGAILAVGMGSSAFSIEPMKKKAKAPTAAEKAAMETKMAEMMKMGAPGENHKVLDQFAGNWNYSSKMWMTADAAKPEVSTGTSSNQWILNGRFLKQEVKGTAMGQPFEGMGLSGYDNMKGEFQSSWYDTMNTGYMASTGKYDPATKTLTENGTFSCIMTGEKNRPYKATMTYNGPDSATYTMYDTGADGKEFKGMEIQYTRVK